MAFLLLAYLANLRSVPPSVTALYTASIVGVLVIAAWAWWVDTHRADASRWTDDFARAVHPQAATHHRTILAAVHGLVIVRRNRFQEMRSTEPLPRRHAHSTSGEACSGSKETAAQRTYQAATQQSHSGSIYGVGWRFQSFRINDLEMVDQTGIEPVTS